MSLGLSSRLLLVGDVADPLDDAQWRSTFDERGWRGRISVHRHPGTDGAEPLVGGNHELFDPVFALGGSDLIGPDVVVVGLGRSGTTAQICGLGGRAGGVVAVDGLGGPFCSPEAQIEATLDTVRRIAADPDSLSVATPETADPRLRHGPPPLGDLHTALRWSEAMPVPFLVIETRSSPVDESDAAAVVGAARQGMLERVEGCTPPEVADAVIGWIERSP